VANILADREIRKLIGSVLIGADEKYLNPNGLELRLGKQVLFHSTGEEAALEPGKFLKVSPGESVSIASVEQIDFTAPTVQRHFPGKMLMAFITPTTTMMREGISQVATKIDAGFRGMLNWGLRNGSTKELILEYGEPIFKLTLFLLDSNEAPEVAYGGRPNDTYQGSAGIVRSSRKIPADLPKDRVVSSSFAKLDPKKQLREAGYPFDHIGTELTQLHGKFEVVSKDVLLLKENFESRASELSKKIEAETSTLAGKLEDARKNVLEKVEALFDQKFLRIVGVVIGAAPVMYAGLIFLQDRNVDRRSIAFIAFLSGVVILTITYLLSRRSRSGPRGG
jgi:deoxycytidine triphosphate deaminase